MKKLANKIVAWLKNYAETNNRKAFVVGISGGIDSALVSTLCARTGLPTHLVILPCHSQPDGIELAQKHISWLMKNFSNARSHQLKLDNVFDAFEQVSNVNGYVSPLGYANAKSRLRMIALYHVATVVGGLVVGTGNKIEDFGVGFFTKYGDGGVDLSPIADLTKTEVRVMAKSLGICDEIVNAVPTDGLWADTRSDEDQLGASYTELEWAMAFREREPGFVPGLTTGQTEVLSVYDKWHRASAHKLTPIPVFKRS